MTVNSYKINGTKKLQGLIKNENKNLSKGQVYRRKIYTNRRTKIEIQGFSTGRTANKKKAEALRKMSVTDRVLMLWEGEGGEIVNQEQNREEKFSGSEVKARNGAISGGKDSKMEEFGGAL